MSQFEKATDRDDEPTPACKQRARSKQSKQKTYLVSFCVRDYYRIQITAKSEDDALDQAQTLYDDEHEAAFEFDFDNGGTCDWQADEVKP